jgi:hypothetical protein
MKNRLAIFLLIIFCTDITGYYLVFSFRQIINKQNIKYSIRQNLPNELLALIISTPSTAKELHWKEKGEFRYHGNMFDVVRKEIKSGDTIFYYCIEDKKETKLISNLDEFVKRSRETQKEDSSRLHTYLTFHSTIFFRPVIEFYCCFKAIEQTYNYILSRYQTFIPDILNPPPEKENLSA